MQTVGNRIMIVLSDNNLKQSELAARLKVNPSSVSTWISGKTNPSAQTIQQICDIYGYNPEWLAYGRGDPKNPPEPDNPAVEEVQTALAHAINHNSTSKDSLLRAIAGTSDHTIDVVLEALEDFLTAYTSTVHSRTDCPPDSKSTPE